MTIELNNITSGYSTSLINENFEKLEQYINESLFNRDNLGVGEANQMELPLDMNGHPILNISTVGSDSLASKEYVDAGDDNLKSLLDDVEAGYQAGDANLQAQLSGGTPLEASAFSEISWHGQVVENSVTIPDAKNAWSFGPKMSIADGQAVTIPDGSFWTVAEGSEPGKVDTVTANAPLVQSGTEENPVIDLPNATVTDDGAMSSEDKTKLDGIEAGAEANTVDSVAGKTGAVSLVKGDVGLGNVENYTIASQAEAQAGTSNTVYMTPLRTKEEVEGGNLTIDASTLNSFDSSGATAANTVPVRDASGDITTNLFRSDYAGATNPSVDANFFVTMVETGAGNNYLRPTTVAAAQNRIGQFINMPSVGGDDIVERGSNADGYWTRWADGTQVCWNDHISVTLSTSARVAVGGATLPVSFVDTAIVVTANPHGEAGGWNDANDRDISISTRVISASFIEAVCWKNSAATFAGTSGEWQYVAYGRWK